MGVGGDDSWTASVHEDFLIQPQFYEMIYSFEIFKGKDYDNNDDDILSISDNMI